MHGQTNRKIEYERLIRTVWNVNPPAILDIRSGSSELEQFSSKSILKAELILNQLARFNTISPVSSEKGKGARIFTTASFD